MTINSPRLEIVRAWYKAIENITNNFLGSVVEAPIGCAIQITHEKSHALLESYTINFIDPITFYVRLSNLHTMKLDERTLSNVLYQHVMPTGTYQKIKIISYFRPRKLGSCFSTRPPKD